MDFDLTGACFSSKALGLMISQDFTMSLNAGWQCCEYANKEYCTKLFHILYFCYEDEMVR